jgi:hypothetical protein
MTALSGETNKSFMPLANGSYALEETESNCTDTSACYVFQFNGTRGSTLQDIGIFPNPATNRLSITSPQILRDARIGIYNATGQRMREWEYSGFNRAELELALPQGFYLLRIQSAQGSLTKSLLVE